MIINFYFDSIVIQEHNPCGFSYFKLNEFFSQTWIWSILVYCPWPFEKSKYFEWSILRMLIWSCWLMVLLNCSIFLLISYLVQLIVRKKVFQSPTIIVHLSISPFSSLSFLFVNFTVLLFDTHLRLLCLCGGFIFSLHNVHFYHWSFSLPWSLLSLMLLQALLFAVDSGLSDISFSFFTIHLLVDSVCWKIYI